MGDGEIESTGRIRVAKIGGWGFWSWELWLNSVCSIWLSCLSAPLEVNVFLHWVIDPTVHPGPWRWGDYRDEREWKVRDGEGDLWSLRTGER